MSTNSQPWRQQIMQQYMALRKNEATIHNTALHKSILATWERDSPKMWANLTKMHLAGPLAYVLQQRMWDRQKELLETGMPVTDAREQAEKELLMLEPEASVPDRSLPMTPPL